MGITSVNPTEALFIALSGILIVFAMLTTLSLIITVISRLIPGDKVAKSSGAGNGSAGAATVAGDSAATSVVSGATPATSDASADSVPYGGTVKLLDVDEKTAACIMAIVSHQTQIPLSELVFKSIKALK